MSQISILLGAGFSVNKGYPTANQLNNKITDLRDADFCIASQGSFCFLEEGQKDPYDWSDYYMYKLFSLGLIKFYADRHDFNYEEFYDFYKGLDAGNKDEEFEEFCNTFRAKFAVEIDNSNLLGQHDKIFNQMISAFLVDRHGNKFYEPVSYTGATYEGYTGFLRCLQQWKKDHIVHIHTLNHDLFFESLNSSTWLEGELTDGFIEIGSPFYGEIEGGSKVRLPYFSKDYESNLRLYKLHGSLDQYPFHIRDKGIDSYIKIKYGVGITDLYKEVLDNETGKLDYINDFINYFPDFLSGTTSKILRYRDPIYYEYIFRQFEENLEKSDCLIAIGYGGGDSEINNIIDRHLLKGSKIFIVDPYPHKGTMEFVERFNAKLIEKTPNDLSIEEL